MSQKVLCELCAERPATGQSRGYSCCAGCQAMVAAVRYGLERSLRPRARRSDSSRCEVCCRRPATGRVRGYNACDECQQMVRSLRHNQVTADNDCLCPMGPTWGRWTGPREDDNPWQQTAIRALEDGSCSGSSEDC